MPENSNPTDSSPGKFSGEKEIQFALDELDFTMKTVFKRAFNKHNQYLLNIKHGDNIKRKT